MKSVSVKVILFAGAISLCSCGPLVYTNFGPNAPLLKEKGETSLSGAMNVTTDEFYDDNLVGVSLTGATALGNHFAIAGSFHYAGGESEDEWTRHSSYWELGGGWFKPGKGKLVTEVYAGTGFGTIKNNSTGAQFYDVKYAKPFVQPSVGWRFRSIDLAVTSKFAVVNFTSESKYIADDYYPADKLANTFVWEPAFTFRVGKAVKFQYQLSYSTFNTDYNDYYYSHNLFMSAGIIARFGPNRE
jgi:hypothetical protein